MKPTCCCILVVSGSPGIGKTTFSQQICDYMQNRQRMLKPFLISYDDLIDTELESHLIANTNENEWKQARNFIIYLVKLFVNYLMMNEASRGTLDDFLETETRNDSSNFKLLIKKRFLNLIHKMLYSQQNQSEHGNLLVLDDLFYYESMRYSFFKLAIELECAYVSFCFKAETLELLLERNSSREMSKRLNELVIRNVWEKFEFPNENIWENGFSRVELVTHSFKIDESYLNETVVDIGERIKKFREFLEKRKLDEISKKHVESEQVFSLSHECDLILRKLIGEKLAKVSDKNEKSSIAQKCSIAKGSILNEIKLDFNDLRTRLMGQNDENERFVILEKEFQNKIASFNKN